MPLRKKLFRYRPLGNDSGFSLVEMLLASAILPIVFFAVFANMSSGMRVWKMFNQPVSQEDTVIFLDRAHHDLSNAFAFTPVPFTGESSRVVLAGRVNAPKTLGGEDGIGRISYFYDDSKNAIIRQEWDISEIHKNQAGQSRVVMEGVSGFFLEYLTYVPTESAYVWKDVWEPTRRPLPAAVRMTISRSSQETISRSFLVPNGN